MTLGRGQPCQVASTPSVNRSTESEPAESGSSAWRGVSQSAWTDTPSDRPDASRALPRPCLPPAPAPMGRRCPRRGEARISFGAMGLVLHRRWARRDAAQEPGCGWGGAPGRPGSKAERATRARARRWPRLGRRNSRPEFGGSSMFGRPVPTTAPAGCCPALARFSAGGRAASRVQGGFGNLPCHARKPRAPGQRSDRSIRDPDRIRAPPSHRRRACVPRPTREPRIRAT